MRIPTLIIITLSILAMSCGTTSTNQSNPPVRGNKPASADRPEPTHPAASVKGVSGKPIRLEWRNLKPANGDLRMGLMNRSSPDSVLRYRKPKEFRDVKAIDDQVMANMLAAIKDSSFYDLAASDTTANAFRMGDGYGVIWVQVGEKNWTLLFKPMGTAARTSPIPRTYRDIKLLIMNVYNQTLDFSPSTSGSRESFRIEPHKYEKPKR